MRRLSIVFLLPIIIILGLFLWWQNGNNPVNTSDTAPRIFVVEKGAGIRAISEKLQKEELIRDQNIFYLLVKKMGIEAKIQAGDFRLNPSMKPTQIADALTHGTLDIWVTIPEGKRGSEIAAILQSKFSQYQDAWAERLEKNEGYLFPDTYLFPNDTNIDQIISIMRDNFDKKYQPIEAKNKAGLTQNDIIILASLVEREAKFADDRPLVASVLHNRLALGMALQIDATIQYALGYQSDEKTWWKKNLTREDLKIDSLYNTYTRPGFPPTPIANPGIDAINAVVTAPDTNYIYYISDKSGHNHYAATLDEHNANIKKYGL